MVTLLCFYSSVWNHQASFSHWPPCCVCIYIYKVLIIVVFRHAHVPVGCVAEDSEAQKEPLQKTEPPPTIHSQPSERPSHADTLQRGAAASSLYSQLYLEAQTSTQWEEVIPAKYARTDGGRGLQTCSPVREHKIPLPATELGDTALVTAKTI